MAKISVIMGVYNAEKRFALLKDSIDSILNQTYSDFEFIICDDGSTDNTFYILKEFEKKDNRIKIIKNETNKGLTHSLNHCLKMSNGEYIARMDDDDISHNIRFEKQIEVLEKNREFDIVGINANLFDDNGIWGEKCYPEILQKKDFLFTSPVTHPTIMARRIAFESVNGYEEKKYTNRTEDYDLFMRMFSKGIKFYTIQQKLFDYREDKNSYKKRKYRYRINEAIVRAKGFKKLDLYPIGIVYVVKPLIVGLIPGFIMRKLHK